VRQLRLRFGGLIARTFSSPQRRASELRRRRGLPCSSCSITCWTFSRRSMANSNQRSSFPLSLCCPRHSTSRTTRIARVLHAQQRVSLCDDDSPEGRPTPDVCGEQRRHNLACCRGWRGRERRPGSLSCPAGCRVVKPPRPCSHLPKVSNRPERFQADSEREPAKSRVLTAASAPASLKRSSFIGCPVERPVKVETLGRLRCFRRHSAL
jgi:hypothetical protein